MIHELVAAVAMLLGGSPQLTTSSLCPFAEGPFDVREVQSAQREIGADRLIEASLKALERDPRFAPGTRGEINLLLLLASVTGADGLLYLNNDRAVERLLDGLSHPDTTVRLRISEAVRAPSLPKRHHSGVAEAAASRLKTESDPAVAVELVNTVTVFRTALGDQSRDAMLQRLWAFLDDLGAASPGLHDQLEHRIARYEAFPLPEGKEHVHPLQTFYEAIVRGVLLLSPDAEGTVSRALAVQDEEKSLAVERALIRSVTAEPSALRRLAGDRRAAVLSRLADALVTRPGHAGFVACCLEGTVTEVERQGSTEDGGFARELRRWFETRVRPRALGP